MPSTAYRLKQHCLYMRVDRQEYSRLSLRRHSGGRRRSRRPMRRPRDPAMSASWLDSSASHPRLCRQRTAKRWVCCRRRRI